MQELEDSKNDHIETERRHRDVVTRLEKKFFEEKIRLQKEANTKIDELATKAHKEAVTNLKETTKDVYKENIRMSTSLIHHVEEGVSLTKINAELVLKNQELSGRNEMHSVIVKEKIVHCKKQEIEVCSNTYLDSRIKRDDAINGRDINTRSPTIRKRA